MAKQVKIVIDESEKDKLYLLGILEFTPAQEVSLTTKFTKIRQHIKHRLIERKPSLAFHPELMGNLLPELHGEAMAQSGGYYRNNKNPDKMYWKEHFQWYEQALIAIKHISPKFYVVMRDGYNPHVIQVDQISGARFKIIESKLIKEYPEVSQASIDKFKAMVSNQYVSLLPLSMIFMDRLLFIQNKFGNLICDNKDECKGFSNLDLWSTLDQHNLHKNLGIPQFLSSLDEPLIQAADLISYITAQNIYINRTHPVAKSEGEAFKHHWFQYAYKKYVKDLDLSHLAEEKLKTQEMSRELAAEMASEIAIKSAKFPPRVAAYLSKSSRFSAGKNDQNEPEPPSDEG